MNLVNLSNCKTIQVFTLIGVAVAVLALAAISTRNAQKVKIDDFSKKIGFQSGAILNVEVADTAAKRAKGLMNRTSMDQNSGMLFDFKTPMVSTFWMKDTLIPLDMMWVDKDLNIVYIQKDAKPCTTAQCPSYGSHIPSLYVVETNSGWTTVNNVQVGQKISIQ